MPRRRASDLAWDMVVAFFQAKRLFGEQYEAYESQVLRASEERGVHRSELHMEAAEVASLLDFDKLDVLCATYLTALKDLSAEVFGGSEPRELFDYYVTNIYHEISILKEEHHEVRQYGPDDRSPQEGEEYDLILDEVHEYFPKRVHRCHKLFRKAQQRLDELLVRYRETKVFVRSLYFMGQEALAEAYDGTLADFYKQMYDGGIVEGYIEAARSFFAGGFHDLAGQALRKANDQVAAGLLPEDHREGLVAKVAEMERLLASA